MNFAELQTFIEAQAKTASPYPTEMGKKRRWEIERDEMLQHYEGIAFEVLEAAFPNEEQVILDYRKKIYQPITRGAFLKAVDEIWRLFSSSRYAITYGDTNFEKWADSPMWDGMSIEQWVLRVAYACRVVDPNGYIILLPKGDGLKDAKKKVDVDLAIINSKDIVVDMKDLLSWTEGKTDYGVNTEVVTHYMTDEVYAISRTKGDGREIDLVYTHLAERLPAVKLGGRTVIEIEKGRPKSRQISDFAHALPLMNSLAVVDNQYVSVMLSSCFPHRFIQGVPCKKCHGVGRINTNNADGVQVQSDCGTCQGTGQIFPVSPLKGYFMNPAPPGVTPDERKAMAERKPIEFAAPDIGTIQFLAERRDKLKTELNESLDIQTAQTFAQSGVSKEKDREGMYIQISRIADYWFNVMLKSVLDIAQIYWEPIPANRGTISVTAPVSFDIKNEGDLLEEFISLFGSAPMIMRYAAFSDYVQKRFSNNPVLARANMLAVQYAPLSLATEAEKRGRPEIDLVKAFWAMPLLLEIVKETNGFMNSSNKPMTDEEILKLLEVKIAPRLEAAERTAAATTLADGALNF